MNLATPPEKTSFMLLSSEFVYFKKRQFATKHFIFQEIVSSHGNFTQNKSLLLKQPFLLED